MKIGVIVYSQTGNTRAVARRLTERLGKSGHAATLDEIKVSGEVHPGSRSFRFETRPDPASYDAVVFAAQVMAFSLSPVMNRYLAQILSLSGKKVGLLVTQAFPYAWMGGSRAIARMRKLCESKGASVVGVAIVNWMNKKRAAMIADAVEKLGAAF